MTDYRNSKRWVAAACLSLSFGVAAESLTVVSWGGAYSASQRKAFHEPFMQETGNVVLEDEWGGELAALRALVDTGVYKWDVIDVETSTALAACDEGLLERIDTDKLGLVESDFVDGGLIECGVATISWATVMAHRTDMFTDDQPSSWVDFWDVNKYPGKRGLNQTTAYHQLEIALMGDGVKPSQVYDVLRSEGGVERAFSSLDKLRSHIVWWTAGAQPPQLLADKEVVMTSAWNGRIYNAVVNENQPFAIAWAGQLYDFEYWVIPAGHPKVDLAYEYIAFASRPDRQGDRTNYISYGTTIHGADKYSNPDVLPHLPTSPVNLTDAVRTDPIYWRDNIEELTARLQTWLAKGA